MSCFSCGCCKTAEEEQNTGNQQTRQVDLNTHSTTVVDSSGVARTDEGDPKKTSGGTANPFDASQSQAEVPQQQGEAPAAEAVDRGKQEAGEMIGAAKSKQGEAASQCLSGGKEAAASLQPICGATGVCVTEKLQSSSSCTSCTSEPLKSGVPFDEQQQMRNEDEGYGRMLCQTKEQTQKQGKAECGTSSNQHQAQFGGETEADSGKVGASRSKDPGLTKAADDGEEQESGWHKLAF